MIPAAEVVQRRHRVVIGVDTHKYDRVRSEAAWARLCGVAPLPASSGLTKRHRLNRGGHRQATPPSTAR